MTITVQIPLDIEMQIREKASRGDTDAVRHLLLEALAPTVEAWIESPSLILLAESGEYWPHLRSMVRAGRISGPMVHGTRPYPL